MTRHRIFGPLFQPKRIADRFMLHQFDNRFARTGQAFGFQQAAQMHHAVVVFDPVAGCTHQNRRTLEP